MRGWYYLKKKPNQKTRTNRNITKKTKQKNPMNCWRQFSYCVNKIRHLDSLWLSQNKLVKVWRWHKRTNFSVDEQLLYNYAICLIHHHFLSFKESYANNYPTLIFLNAKIVLRFNDPHNVLAALFIVISLFVICIPLRTFLLF